VLLLGPVFPVDNIGGLQLAIKEVAEQLTDCGWQVETCIDEAVSSGSDKSADVKLQGIKVRSRLSAVSRFKSLFNAWHRLPPALRSAISTPLKPRAYFEKASANLSAIESRLAELGKEDVVICFVDESAPGMTAMVTSLHRRALVTSLGGLAYELRASWWSGVRIMCRIRFGRRLHPFLFQRASASQLALAVFASRGWMEQAVAAGLPRERARTIYFGIPLPPPLPRPVKFRARILWVGRLVPSKGLHLILDALSSIREQVQEVSLTAVAGQGQAEYRQFVLELIERYGLAEAVILAPPVPREALQDVYARHDVLFFYSQYSDPVALVLMEAFATGLPVISSRAGAESALVKEGVTCLCYDPDSRESIVNATLRMLQDATMRDALATNAGKLVEDSFSLEAMGREYDELLREISTN
jgi:glycosyltransferase involved in cell wall biosynthesis